MKILHLTTVHNRRDTRIFYREVLSLSKSGYNVYLVVADGKGDEEINGCQIIDIGKESNRAISIIKGYGKIIDFVSGLKPCLVHFHDPELIFVGRKISRMKIPVVFDIHENIAVQILDKKYIPRFLRKPMSFFYRIIENKFIRSFHLVLAESSYKEVYNHRGKSLTTVLNMPEINHFAPFINIDRLGNGIFYIGGVSNDRGLNVTLDALKLLKKRNIDCFMNIIGPISKSDYDNLDLEEISDRIKFYGHMDSKLGFEISKECFVGLSVLKPIKNYLWSYSTKIFEYMAIGLPVITSSFKLYKDVVERHQTGYCIDPYSPLELANKIESLFNDREKVRVMGLRGMDAVKKEYNWTMEEEKLLKLYYKLVN